MEKQPAFFVIAGPNGAGKSTNGHQFVPTGVSVFNGDMEFARLQLKYPLIEPDRLQGGVASILENAKYAALEKKQDFAFETNYSTDMATEMTELFKQNGYQAILVYFGLNNLMESASRVRQRTDTGGHNVSNEVLQYNFEEGIKRVNKDLSIFDNIIFVDTRTLQPTIISAIDNRQKLQYSNDNGIHWYMQHFKHAVEDLSFRQTRKVRKVLPLPIRKFNL